VVAISAPTPPPQPAHHPHDRGPLPGRPDPGAPPGPARSRRARALDVVARVGTAVTLAALLVLTGTVLGLLDAAPTPAGVTTAGH
jgi:hypothetical protein